MKPGQIVMVVAGVLLTLAIFGFHGQIRSALGLPDPNAAYREQYAAYQPADAMVVSVDVHQGRRGSHSTLKVQFQGPDGQLVTGVIDCRDLLAPAVGDSVAIWFDPQQPSTMVDELTYLEVTGKH